MFGRTADYALRALLLLARERQSGFYLRADEIADATGAPRNYTSKVLGELARAGFIASSRGPTGGFRLLRPANQITVGAVIDRFDSPVNNPRCLNGNGPCNPKQPCAAHQRWKAVLKAQREPLDRTTIDDLVDHRIASPLPPRTGGHA